MVSMARKTLQSLIKAAGHTHRSLAKKTGIHYTYFSHWGRGHRVPSLDQAATIAKALKVSLDELHRALGRRAA